MPKIDGYHAHVYYSDPATRGDASELRDGIDSEFGFELGRWRDDPVGPHPVGSYQVKFSNDDLGRFVPWLLLNHRELSVLIHPLTGDDLADHTTLALWVGKQLKLRTEFFSR